MLDDGGLDESQSSFQDLGTSQSTFPNRYRVEWSLRWIGDMGTHVPKYDEGVFQGFAGARCDRRQVHTERQPTSSTKVATPATITNAVAVPSSQITLRSTMPTVNVMAHSAKAHVVDVGWRQRRSTSQPRPKANKNGAAVPTTPDASTASWWLRRPTTMNATIATASAMSARIATGFNEGFPNVPT